MLSSHAPLICSLADAHLASTPASGGLSSRLAGGPRTGLPYPYYPYYPPRGPEKRLTTHTTPTTRRGGPRKSYPCYPLPAKNRPWRARTPGSTGSMGSKLVSGGRPRDRVVRAVWVVSWFRAEGRGTGRAGLLPEVREGKFSH